MKDSERLELLKDIAGTRVYDERREESMKIMKDSGNRAVCYSSLTMHSESKRQKINETLEYIEQRLGELELEKKELQEYHALDRKRRALEFTIYDKELSQCIASLEEIEAERERKADSASAIHAQALQAHDSHRNVEKQIKAKENEILRALKEKELREEEKQDLIKDRAKLELDVKDGEAKIQRESATKVLHLYAYFMLTAA
jgi:structural maintenance of chromosome 3 (chondroitin sulfate proteoglycan 6)